MLGTTCERRQASSLCYSQPVTQRKRAVDAGPNLRQKVSEQSMLGTTCERRQASSLCWAQPVREGKRAVYAGHNLWCRLASPNETRPGLCTVMPTEYRLVHYNLVRDVTTTDHSHRVQAL